LQARVQRAERKRKREREQNPGFHPLFFFLFVSLSAPPSPSLHSPSPLFAPPKVSCSFPPPPFCLCTSLCLSRFVFLSHTPSLSFSLTHPLRRCWNFFVFPSPSPYSVTGWVKPGVTHYNALKHTAARCSTLQHTAMHCDALQCCSVLQCAAVYCVCCSVLQLLNDASYKTFQQRVGDLLTVRMCAVCCSVLQHVAVCRSMLQRVAACCSVLQRLSRETFHRCVATREHVTCHMCAVYHDR